MKNVSKLRSKLILLLILFYAILSRLWMIDSIPQIINSDINQRLITAFLNIGSVYLLYFLSLKIIKSEKAALLSSWVFMIMPWVVEQGRITSQVSNFLFFLLLILILLNTLKSFLWKSLTIVAAGLMFYMSYRGFWLFRSNPNIPSLNSLLNNIFLLLSPDFLFFRNITFWWGGVRDAGVFFPSFIPFAVVGLIRSAGFISEKIWLFIGLIIFITALNPSFPETRELFLVTPFFSIIVALGIQKIFELLFRRNIYSRLIAILFFFFIIYDLTQFNHYYFIHYSQNVVGSSSNIHEPF